MLAHSIMRGRWFYFILPAHALGWDRPTVLHAHVVGHVVGMMMIISSGHAVHHERAKTLGLGDRAVLVRK